MRTPKTINMKPTICNGSNCCHPKAIETAQTKIGRPWSITSLCTADNFEVIVIPQTNVRIRKATVPKMQQK